jgi:hypothetical protein
MSTDLTPVQHSSLHRSGYTGSDDYLSKADFQRRRAKFVAALLVITLAVNCAAAIRLAIKSHEAPPIIGFASGYFFRPTPQAVNVTVQSYFPQFRDTVETLFRRTEKGSLPQLDDFLGEGVREMVDGQYTQLREANPTGFVQSYSVLDQRADSMSAVGGAVMLFSGIWTARSTSGMSTQTLFLRATYKLGATTELNATGWRLSKLEPITEDDFFAEERAAQRAARFGVEEPKK